MQPIIPHPLLRILNQTPHPNAILRLLSQIWLANFVVGFAFASFPSKAVRMGKEKRWKNEDEDVVTFVLVVCHTSYACFFLRRLRHLSPAHFFAFLSCDSPNLVSRFLLPLAFRIFRGYFPE